MNKLLRAAELLLLLVLTLRCTPGGARDEPISPPAEVLYFESVGAGQAATIQDTTEVLVRDSMDWRGTAAKLRPREPLRPVEFSQYMVALVALPQTTGGFRIEFQSVEKQDDEIMASYVVYAPGTDCMTISALTVPFQAVAVRRTSGKIRFLRSVERESCSID